MAYGPALSRIGRGLRRKGGRRPGTDVNFRLLPNWKQTTRKAVGPDLNDYGQKVHEGMARGMRQASRRNPGGGIEEEGDDLNVGIGSPPGTHTHWHLIEFGGGRHYGRGVVRRELKRFGKFKEQGPQ
jgi:hypothetical protein